MIKIYPEDKISKRHVLDNIENDRFVYRIVCAADFYDLVGMTIETANERFVDKVIEKGYLLEDISYAIVAVTGADEVTIEVSTDATTYIKECNEQ
jgi:hypothetical protein